MNGSTRVGIALTLLSVVACTDAPTAPSPTPSTATDPALADARIAARPYVAVSIGDLGGGSALARDINLAGVIVGSSMTTGGEVHAFIWSRQRGMRDLGTLPGDTRSDAVAVNLLGEAVGTSGNRPVRWDASGQIHELAAPGSEYGAATGINLAGMVSGWAYYPRIGYDIPERTLPVFWNRAGTPTAIEVPAPRLEGEAVAINDLGLMAATVGYDIGHGTRAAVWSRRAGWRLLEPQVPDGRATNLNLIGDVVGIDLGQPWAPPATLWRRDGSFTQLTPSYGYARDINTLRQIVGISTITEFGTRRPVMWSRDLTITVLPVPSQENFAVNAINDIGDIAGGIGNLATVWTRSPESFGKTTTATVVASVVSGAAAAAPLATWIAPEYQRCSRRTGPLQMGEALCGS